MDLIEFTACVFLLGFLLGFLVGGFHKLMMTLVENHLTVEMTV